MEQNYAVIIKVHNKETGAWANQVSAQYDNGIDAKAKYHSELARLLPVDEFDFVMVAMIDTFGNGTSEFRDSRTESEEVEE